MLDLASRGELQLQARGRAARACAPRPASRSTTPTTTTTRTSYATGASPLSYAEQYALERLRGIAAPLTGNYIDSTDMLEFGKYISGFNDPIERTSSTRAGSASRRPRRSRAGPGAAILALIVGLRPLHHRRQHSQRRPRTFVARAALIAAGGAVMTSSPVNAGANDGRRDDLRDACGISADDAEHHGPGAIDEHGRRAAEPGVDGDTRPGRPPGASRLGLQHDVEESRRAAPRTPSRV